MRFEKSVLVSIPYFIKSFDQCREFQQVLFQVSISAHINMKETLVLRIYNSQKSHNTNMGKNQILSYQPSKNNYRIDYCSCRKNLQYMRP